MTRAHMHSYTHVWIAFHNFPTLAFGQREINWFNSDPFIIKKFKTSLCIVMATVFHKQYFINAIRQNQKRLL